MPPPQSSTALTTLRELLHPRWPDLDFLGSLAASAPGVASSRAHVFIRGSTSRLAYCEALPGAEFPLHPERRTWLDTLRIAPGDLIVFGSTCRTRFLVGGYVTCEDQSVYVEQPVGTVENLEADILRVLEPRGGGELESHASSGIHDVRTESGGPADTAPVGAGEIDTIAALRAERGQLTRTIHVDPYCTDADWLLERARELVPRYLQLVSRMRSEVFDHRLRKRLRGGRLADFLDFIRDCGGDGRVGDAVAMIRRIVVRRHLFGIAPSRSSAETVRIALDDFCCPDAKRVRLAANVRVGCIRHASPEGKGNVSRWSRPPGHGPEEDDFEVLSFARRFVVDSELGGGATAYETRRAFDELERRRRALVACEPSDGQAEGVHWRPDPALYFPELIGRRWILGTPGRRGSGGGGRALRPVVRGP